MRAVWSTHAAAMAICLLSVLALSQLHLVNSKSSGSGGGGKSSSGSSSGSSGSSKSTSSMSSSAKTSAAAAAGGTSKTSWGGGKSGGKWTFGGSTTKGGSTLYKGSGGRVYSSRPRYYGSGAHTSSGWVNRPIMYSAVAGATAFAFYGHSYARLPACGSYSGFFAYGNGCRSCSDWECPIGQYRVPCTPWTDSYCTRCTNAPEDQAEYTSPGNCWYSVEPPCEDGGSCQYSYQPPFPVPAEMSPTDPASLQIIFEVPSPSLSFKNNTASFIATVAAVARVSISDVRIEGVEERPVSSISSCSDAKCPLYRSAMGELSSASFQNPSSPISSSTSSSSTEISDPEQTCRYMSFSCDKISSGGWGAAASAVCKADTSSYKCDYSSLVTGVIGRTAAEACPKACAPYSGRRNSGAPNGCSTTPDSSEKLSLVSVAVDTVVGTVDQTWDNLNEYDVNKAMAGACLWPAVMTYDPLDPGASSSANTIQRDWVYTATALSFVLMLVNVFQAVHL